MQLLATNNDMKHLAHKNDRASENFERELGHIRQDYISRRVKNVVYLALEYDVINL